MRLAASPSPALALSPAPLPLGAVLEVRLDRSRFGCRTPSLEVRLPRGVHFRQLHVALHQLAALAEASTPHSERWCIQTERLSDGLGYVFLELTHDTDSEAQRGLALLEAVRAAIPLPAPF